MLEISEYRRKQLQRDSHLNELEYNQVGVESLRV